MLWSFTYPVLNWLTNCFIFGCQCKRTTEVDEISEIYGRLHMWLLKCLLSWSKKVSLVRPNWWFLWTNSLILYFSVVICLLLQKWWINSARTTIETWDSVAYFLPLITTSQQTKDATTHNTEQIRPSLSCPCCTSQIWCLCLHTRSKYSHCVVWTHTIVQRDKVINLVFSFCWRHLFYHGVYPTRGCVLYENTIFKVSACIFRIHTLGTFIPVLYAWIFSSSKWMQCQTHTQ